MDIARNSIAIKPGDTLAMYVSIKRKWYQVWKPRWAKELRKFTVVESPE